MKATKPTLGFAAALGLILTSVPAEAGRWVNGGGFDVEQGVPVSFLRFLADESEGQMTIRCDPRNGLSVDAGVTGNGELPAGLGVGDQIEAVFAFRSGDSVQRVGATGQLTIRGDGAVMVSITGGQTVALGTMLLQPAESLAISIAGVSAPIPIDGLAERALALAAWCGAWPTDGSITNVNPLN